jgi:hypothetical protein
LSEEQTPGRAFFNAHMEYIGRKDVDGMIDDQYTQDAVLISPFDLLETPPPHIVRGNQALKDFFRKYLDWQGALDDVQLPIFAGTENSIFFQATFKSQTGFWAVGDAWHMTDGKIDTHYSFAQKLG